MNTLLLHPSDVLFFRDGRPMGGSLSGHGAAFPLPTTINAAFHAALHRAELDGVHNHRRGRSGNYVETRDRKFGSLLTAGPFPVLKKGKVEKEDKWLFPRPLDAGASGSAQATLLPLVPGGDGTAAWSQISSLPQPLTYATANTLPPDKDNPAPWWNTDAWATYLGTGSGGTPTFHEDSSFSDTEHDYGIGMDPGTGTQDGERFYSAHYLRLKPECRLGMLAEAQDKTNGDPSNKKDLIAEIFPNSGTETPIIVGGQQRACTVIRDCKTSIPLPRGKSDGFTKGPNGKYLVKWVLLSPAIFPEIGGHKGGWLPSWARHTDGQVMLKGGDTARSDREGRDAWRRRVAALPGIPATLVAAMTGKPVTVTGYALPHEAAETSGGAKPTLLAVPAGSVYYFECDSAEAATALATALNWHGAGDFTTIRNRRSTLMGEKGFGLGVCASWTFHDGTLPTTNA